MTKLRVLDDAPLNPRALAARYTTLKPMACYECREPNATFEVYEITGARPDDCEVNYRFRERTDICEPAMRAIYARVEQERDNAQAAGAPFTEGTVLQMRVRPPANRPERVQAGRLPVIRGLGAYLHNRFFYDRGQCEIDFLRRYETPRLAPQNPPNPPNPPAAARPRQRRAAPGAGGGP